MNPESKQRTDPVSPGGYGKQSLRLNYISQSRGEVSDTSLSISYP